MRQEGFLPCQTPTSTVRLKVEGCRVNNLNKSNNIVEACHINTWIIWQHL